MIKTNDFTFEDGKVEGELTTDGQVDIFGETWEAKIKFIAVWIPCVILVDLCYNILPALKNEYGDPQPLAFGPAFHVLAEADLLCRVQLGIEAADLPERISPAEDE